MADFTKEILDIHKKIAENNGQNNAKFHIAIDKKQIERAVNKVKKEIDRCFDKAFK